MAAVYPTIESATADYSPKSMAQLHSIYDFFKNHSKTYEASSEDIQAHLTSCGHPINSSHICMVRRHYACWVTMEGAAVNTSLGDLVKGIRNVMDEDGYTELTINQNEVVGTRVTVEEHKLPY